MRLHLPRHLPPDAAKFKMLFIVCTVWSSLISAPSQSVAINQEGANTPEKEKDIEQLF